MKFSTLAIMAYVSLAIAKPIPDSDNVVPIRWNDVEANIHAAQASAAVNTPNINIAARHVPGMFSEHKSKSGAEQGFQGGSGLWGRNAKHEDDSDHEFKAVLQNIEKVMAGGDKSGAETGGFHGGSHLWGRAPEPAPEPKKHSKPKVNGGIVNANPFDQGGNHSNDPSWG